MIDIINILKKEKNINIPDFKTGDTICVNFNIIDNKYKNRNQNFEGIVLSKKKWIKSNLYIKKNVIWRRSRKNFFYK